MAVARIIATRRWYLKAAEAVKDHKRLNRELKRAAERRGLRAEIGADEARVLAERMPKDPRALKALQEIEELEVYEANRPRARDIALGRVRREGIHGPWSASPKEEEIEYGQDPDYGDIWLASAAAEHEANVADEQDAGSLDKEQS